MSDQLPDRRRRILTDVDNCTRERLALVADSSPSGIRMTWISSGKPIAGKIEVE